MENSKSDLNKFEPTPLGWKESYKTTPLKDESVKNKRKVLLRELKSGKRFEGKFIRVRD